MKKYIGIISFLIIATFFFYIPTAIFFAVGLNIRDVNLFSEYAYWVITAQTVMYSMIAAITCAYVSTPIALSISVRNNDQLGFRWMVALLPLIVNPIAIIFGWIFILRDSGLISGFAKLITGGSILYTPMAVMIGMVYLGIPIMTFFIVNSIRNIDANILIAAKQIGASERQIFWKIIFPLTKQGYTSGVTFVFLSSCGYFIIPSLLGGAKVTFVSSIIENMVNRLLNWSGAAQLSLQLLVAIIIILSIIRLISKKKNVQNI